jgi:hypothetical protein
MEDNLQLIAPASVTVEAEMSVEQFTAAVRRAADSIQTGINGVWTLGQRAVKMAYGCSPYAAKFIEVLINELPKSAQPPTFDWLKKAGIVINKPLPGSKLYYCGGVERVMVEGGDAVQLVTVKKPGDDGFGIAKERAIEYVKTRPPMAIEKKEAKVKPVKVIEGPVKNRVRDALVRTMKRVQKDGDADAAREINDLITTTDANESCLYDANGMRQKLEKVELKVASKAIEAINEGTIDAETILKVLSGDYKIVLEEVKPA